ncbi:7TM GPCR, serpentine receptor class ab (Srab) family-containing protein [Strongyloides ratti]|uniref:7TM GPCR, serpentine receptor class ab (Srab) family-containing protein n=1 Tax=Strongyloides ratti TaxID=34506 RepID=A0A090L916_STRRB|nr:7TM GPCR, serpentine receptor class ab (Srab) family-containing protein [Strongyloides ratti]CEF66207.1 7TM GPCR, serpentine receptor class ab (Srab) family-containing protein [Strongyloides ratti]
MDKCEDAYLTTSNPVIITVWIGLIIQNFMCFYGLLLITYFLIKYKFYHLHLRILICNLHFAFFIRTFGTTYRGFDFLVKLITKKNDNCNLLQDKAYCLIISTINGSSVSVFLYTFAAISIERIVASVFYKKYETYSIIFLPFLAIFLIWIQPVLRIYKTFTNPTLWTNIDKLPYCNSFTAKQADPIIFFKTDFPICIIVFFLNISIYLYCRYRLRNIDDTKIMDNRLTVKFELKEILSSTLLVTILGIIYAIDLALNTIFIYILSITDYKSNKNFAIDKELSAYIIPVYILIYIGIFITLSDKIKEKMIGIFCKSKRTVLSKSNTIVPATNEVEKYFQIYNNTWA